MRQGMDCAQVRHLWPGWIDGSLSAGQATAVAAHVATCPGCAGRWQREDPVAALAVFGDPAQAPSGLAAAVLAALPAHPEPVAAATPLGPAVLAALLVGAVWLERLRFAAVLAPLAGIGLAWMGAAVGAVAGVAATAAPATPAVFSWSILALTLLVVAEVPVCAHLLRLRPRPR